MINETRSYESLDKKDLEKLKDLAIDEHKRFFEKNPHLRPQFEKTLVGICLCQGAASHYLDPSVGIKDFDIWHFYIEHRSRQFPYRAHRRIPAGHNGKPIDFLKRAIPKRLCNSSADDPGQTIMEYLLERNTYTKKKLLKKAVIGLFPDGILGKVLWTGEK